ncbi:MAG: NfeD family protein [Ruminococcaceae bacterium]|nr:NfeD family protein [Oscillospiraceae bacterium]
MMITIWAAAIVVFFVIEAITVGVASIWFALGSICALIAALLGAPEWLQIAWFVVISVVTLIFTRPIVKKYVHGKRQATNADRVIGMKATVRESIDNLAAKGSVMTDGKEWTARSANGEPIASGSVVTVLSIEGVKLIVEPFVE